MAGNSLSFSISHGCLADGHKILQPPKLLDITEIKLDLETLLMTMQKISPISSFSFFGEGIV
ncbi:hypothetical protein [Dendronalium sp. ChiSLP03b]|uniref:hypothetical protein n=1 Tax=Dendronalium sp. ChiSLP03b TaxID=3075381 RepID=UPI002AD2ABF9|nr:hypothetical protein [Dendronalium sp. ChiSLP03b]MDZ8205208.1 hypothetical protein [Dendronalium sp. ChiSLP03b]